MIQASDLVTPRTIARCFRHAGFKHPGVTENTPEEDEEEDLPLVQLATRLQAAGMPCSIETPTASLPKTRVFKLMV